VPRLHHVGLVSAIMPITVLSASVSTPSDSAARCSRPVTPGESPTVVDELGVRSAHYDLGGSVRLASGMGGVRSQRLMVGLCRWGALSFGLSHGTGQGIEFVTNESIAAAHADPHRAAIDLFALELQGDLDAQSAIHPIVSVSVGHMSSGWQYSYASPPAGSTRPASALLNSATAYGSAAIGAQFNLFSVLRADVLGGATFMGAVSTPGIASHPLQGPFVSVTIGIGKF